LSAAPAASTPAPAGVELPAKLGPEAFRASVARILDWIHQGDCYQVNLTRAVHVDGIPEPWSVWLRLRAAAGAAYGAYLRPTPTLAVLSSSPELLLAVDGREAWSEPIKGTRPRGATPEADAAQRVALTRSEKDQAELVMIVDLVRNDLGRVAAPGAVRWEPRRIDAHPNVLHASQRVRATLAAGRDGWDALAALSPAGSVTGCPKRRAMQRIAELEPEPRGVYCGSVGFASDHGAARWNVAIRTAVWHDGRARWHVGGGIVADSDPAEEWQETVDKERLLRAAFLG
jgi:para-aminobenzoate synthetase component 1